MTQVFPIATLVDTSIVGDGGFTLAPHTDPAGITVADWCELYQIIAEHGKTYRAAALARAYLDGRGE